MSWGAWLRPRDARGRESRTLAIVGLSWLAMTARFALGGLSADFGDVRWEVGVTAMTDYGVATTAILAAWLGREWIDLKREKPDV